MDFGDIALLVGLGNPGSKYNDTRHNIGFMVLEVLAKKNNVSFRKNKKFNSQITEIDNGTKKQRLIMPDTFMNDSGRAVNAAMKWYGLEVGQLLVIVDDMDLPLGKIRIRAEGSSGGHNGLKSIIQHLGTTKFHRLKIGIGAPSSISTERKKKSVSHVLGSFASSEIPIMKNVINEIIEVLALTEELGWEKITTRINSYKPN